MNKTIKPALNLDKPIIRRKMLTATNPANMSTTIDFGEFGSFMLDEPEAHGGGGLGPSPLQGVLGCLCGCEAVTFNRTAKEMDFNYSGIQFEADFKIDIRGRLGVRGVRPHFHTVRVQAIVSTEETEERLSEVVSETEARCPVFNLIRDAGVKLECLWMRKPTN